MLKQARALIRRDNLRQRAVMVLAGEGWHPGVHRHRGGPPGGGVSPARGPGEPEKRPGPGFGPLHRGVSPLSGAAGLPAGPHRYGGHAAAAGFEVAAEQLAALQEDLEQAFHGPSGRRRLPRPTLKVDAQVELPDLDRDFYRPPGTLRPFGPGNPAPVFVCREVECLGSRVVGKRHLKVQLAHGGKCVMEAIAFDQAAHHPLTGTLEVAFSTRFSNYQGRTIPELLLLDWGGP